jgi:hypothetical protein
LLVRLLQNTPPFNLFVAGWWWWCHSKNLKLESSDKWNRYPLVWSLSNWPYSGVAVLHSVALLRFMIEVGAKQKQGRQHTERDREGWTTTATRYSLSTCKTTRHWMQNQLCKNKGNAWFTVTVICKLQLNFYNTQRRLPCVLKKLGGASLYSAKYSETGFLLPWMSRTENRFFRFKGRLYATTRLLKPTLSLPRL